jgi:hypothetical protein
MQKKTAQSRRNMTGNDIDWAAANAAHRQWILDGKHLAFICPIEGGSIRGWTSI